MLFRYDVSHLPRSQYSVRYLIIFNLPEFLPTNVKWKIQVKKKPNIKKSGNLVRLAGKSGKLIDDNDRWTIPSVVLEISVYGLISLLIL